MPHLPTTTITKTVCCYCGVGCGIEILKHKSGQLELRGDKSHPANRGELCTKGRTLLSITRNRDTRLVFPLSRPTRDDPLVRTTWDAAIARIASEFRRIQAAHGPDAVGFYISGQCLTEEYYLANKIAKGFLHTNNIDTNSRLCMSSAVCGYKATLGSDAVPISYDDIDHADTFLIAGANPAWCHPILFRRIEARKAAAPDTKIIVIDPRRTASCASADLHLQIKPGTDVALFHGLARELWRSGHFDHAFIDAHTTGFEAALESIAPWTLDHTAAACGVPASDIALAASYLAGNRRFLSLWTMGLNQSAMGTDKNIALIQLSLFTGKIGKPGCGPFSLTGQPNAMGGREVGGMANLLPAHRDLANPAHRAHVANFWGLGGGDSIPDKPGLTAVEMFDALRAGKVKAVWIIATNPIASMPNSWRAEESLKNAEFVVVQDLYPTETVDFADVVLPAAGWPEKTGTMTNSDRRIALLGQALAPPGEALPDTEILLRFARAMGWEKSFPYPDPAAIFAEHAALTAGTDCDITVLSHAALKEHGPVQWPAPQTSELRIQNSELGTPRLYTNHVFATATGRARLHAITYHNASEPLDAAFPLVLTTGRIRDQWHTMTRTGQIGALRQHIPSPYCEIHPFDAAERQISDGDILTVTSRRGTVQVRATVTDDIRQGVVFLPMHWGKKLGGHNGSGRANNATSPRLDPISKEPDLKYAAVQVARVAPTPRHLLIIGGGAACLAFIEAHRRYNQLDTITVLSAEPEPIYNRVMLPHYIDGSRPFADLVRGDDDFFAEHRVRYIRNTVVIHIDRTTQQVHARQTSSTENAFQNSEFRIQNFGYDHLILATGSRPAVHYDGPIPESGTHTLRTRRDADGILAAAKHARHIVINGGGLLGIELADALTRLHCHVTIVQRSDRLMGKQLDTRAAAYLAAELHDRGIAICFEEMVSSLVGDPLSEIELQSGRSLPCDMLVFATGTLPNKELAGAAGLNCARGILVDQYLRTSDPGIFAIGECAQVGDDPCGTTAIASRHAQALAEFLRGNYNAPFAGAVSANVLKVEGLAVASAGVIDESSLADTQVLCLDDPARRYYQKLLLRHNCLIGVIMMGSTAGFADLLRRIESGVEVLGAPADLLTRGAAPASDGPLICSCCQVGTDTIRKAAAVPGANLAEVCRSTSAGTACGSCRPEIAALLRKAR